MTFATNSFTAPGTGGWVPAPIGIVTHTATVAGTGAVSATVIHEGTNDVADPNAVFTIWTATLAGTTLATDSGVASHSFQAVRVRVSAISGTNAVARGAMNGV